MPLKSNLPWGQILTSSPVWAIVVTHACDNWGFYTLNTELPAYLKDNFGYSLEEAGEMAAIPYLILALLMIYSGRLADWLKTDGNLTTTQVHLIS
ncbi:Sialin [Blattella germanica]|nr:Sialin [Blattella germanica]